MTSHDEEQQILIVGAGVGGSALLEMFLHDENARVVGVVDIDAAAPGMRLAHAHGISLFSDLVQALDEIGQCIVFNMTHDEAVSEIASRRVGVGSVVGSVEAKLFWQVIERMKAAQRQSQEDHARLQAVLHNVREGIISINTKGIIESANPAIEQVFGYRPDELLGHNIRMLMPEPDKSRHDDYLRNYLRTGKKHVIGRYREVTGLHRDGHTFEVELNVAEMDVDGIKHFVGLMRDISDRKRAEAEITRLALYDQLTGLPNRTLFYQNMGAAIAQARRLKSICVLLFMDLDGFKAVNDSMGHEAGDYLLQEIGKRLQASIRESDVAARIGGDEFTVLLTNVQCADVLPVIATKLIKAVNQPVDFKGQACHVGVSIGIAAYPTHAENGDNLVKEADSAMYAAKAAGKNSYRIAGER